MGAVLKKLVVAAALVGSGVLYVNCGGGGSSGEGGGDGDSSSAQVGAVFVDSIVFGLWVRKAGESTAVPADATSGEFTCEIGELVELFISTAGSDGLKIGEVACAKTITPLDLYPSTSEAVNLGLLLLSLDSNSDPSDGIDLSATTLTNTAEALVTGNDLGSIVSNDASIDSLVTQMVSDNATAASSRAAVTTHFDEQGLNSSGVYTGVATVTADADGGDCSENTDVTIMVGGDQIFFQAFGNFEDGESDASGNRIYFGGQRTVNTGTGDSTFAFNGDVDSDAADDCADAGGGGVVADRVVFSSGTIVGSTLSVTYDSGVQCDSLFISECQGTITATKQ